MHALWEAHEQLVQWMDCGEEKADMLMIQMQQLEMMTVQDMADVMKNYDDKAIAKVAQIFQHMVNLEMNFYK